jgi:putative DNA methylase
MLSPIQQGIEAKPFRRVYSMHRYFARRPHNLFEHLLEHYTEPGDVVVDPFFGGGVTLVEGLNLNRRVIGFDLNPLAAFVTRMEIAFLDDEAVGRAAASLREAVSAEIDALFASKCPSCESTATADWVEVTAIAECDACESAFRIADAAKTGPGVWACPTCSHKVRFVVTANTPEEVTLIRMECVCGFAGTKTADDGDITAWEASPALLADAEASGAYVPNHPFPDCNMQRESALHKKQIMHFRDLFTPRVLLGWSLLRRGIEAQPPGPERDWLWFAFSAALRYSNRMVTRNPGWRGDKPLEWAKPGYWLPPVHLDVNPWGQFVRRLTAIRRAKKTFALDGMRNGTPTEVLKGRSDYSINVQSSTELPLPDESVDAVITDPPYGSYVHYIDLTNFWTVWLPPEIAPGMGFVTDPAEEAVMARKKGFPGAKSADDYRRLLERCFKECFRILKPDSYLVLTFNNREPRAWLAVLAGAAAAGFDLPDDGVIFQDGIKMYDHTSQARRTGSVIGDFVYSFVRPERPRALRSTGSVPSTDQVEMNLVRICESALRSRPLPPRELFTQLYIDSQPYLWQLLNEAGTDRLDELSAVLETISLFDSHRRGQLEKHFEFAEGMWHSRERAA